MMHMVEIKGFTGILKLLAILLVLLATVVALPAFLMMVLWNALVYETLGGPVVGWLQGGLLWSMLLVVLYLIFQPEISLQVYSADGPKPGGFPPSEDSEGPTR
ncbi:MAG: hypothetical protein SFZ03_00590 [Candidatus Melainabacteria bacterium]|nr:hypothetical protein [Candidatus Melainabacteria bacterium]